MSWLLPPLPPKFEAALRDVDAQHPESRMAAAERLGRADGDEREPALSALARLASDAHAGVRATAFAALALVGGERELDLLIAGLDDRASEVREFAALALAQVGGARAIASLVAALARPEPELRFQAVAAVAELAPERAAALLVPLLKDRDAEVRAQVIGAIASLDEPHLVGHIAGALDDEDANVRLEAALALAAQGDVRAEEPLLTAMHARQRLAEVARGLADLGCKRGCDALAALAKSWLTPPHLRAELGAALVRLGDERGTAALARVLGGLRSDARGYAVELSRQVGADGVVPALAQLARRPRGVDLAVLVDALESFAAGSQEARAALAGLARRDDDVGAAATRAIGRARLDNQNR